MGSSATAFRGTSSASAGRRSASRLGSPQKGTRVIWVEKAGLSKLDRRVLPGASAQIAGANPVSDLRPVEHAAAARREIQLYLDAVVSDHQLVRSFKTAEVPETR